MDGCYGERLEAMLGESQVDAALLEGIPDRLTKFIEPFTGSILQAKQRRVGINVWVSTGNEADVAVADLIEAFAYDPSVDVIACYLEGVKDRHAFFRGLEAARIAKKPVVMMKVGASTVGAAAAASHTASLAGSDAVFDAAIRPCKCSCSECTPPSERRPQKWIGRPRFTASISTGFSSSAGKALLMRTMS